MPIILDLDHLRAKEYFLQSANYTNIDLPKYFNFDAILSKVSRKLGDSNVTDFCLSYTSKGKNKRHHPKDFEGVNYKLLGNKDSEYAWRPYELINPALYVALVHKITTEKNWKSILRRFVEFKQTGIICESLPSVSEDNDSNKAHQIKNWWAGIEQRSLELSLKYQYVFDADITDCYGSIYTHSIAWALHGKPTAKSERDNAELLGNIIDRHIQMMRHGQTNGIPQGSVLMDFVAEIVLGYIDIQISNKIPALTQNSFQIVRYRDDYRVFTNNPEDGRKIIKCLSEELSSLGLKLNTSKTRQNTDPVLASVKEDKIDELFIPRNSISLQKKLLQIYAAAAKNPNSGQVSRLLTKYYDQLNATKKLGDYDNPLAMMGIAVNLALKNQKSYQWSMAIVSKLLDHCETTDKIPVIDEIRKKFDRVPNTGLLDIWLQRISYNVDPTIEYLEGGLTSLISSAHYPGNLFWECAWMSTQLEEIVINTPIVESNVLHAIADTIERAEVELFKLSYRAWQ